MSGTCIFAVGSAFWVLIHPKHHDSYAFLKGHALLDVGCLGPSSFGPREYRLYCWKEPVTSVLAKAAKCLPKEGLKPSSAGSPDEAFDWSGSIINGGPGGVRSDLWISILPKRVSNLHDYAKTDDYDLDWTTVVVSQELDKSWFNVLRYTFFSMRD